MARPGPVEPVKRFVALLWREEPILARALEALTAIWGPVDGSGPDHPFDRTDYYRGEMGEDLRRRLVSFAALVPPESLVQAKLRCNEIERDLSREGRRTVNLDVGYLDHHKVILASMKGLGHKIHLGQGVYADWIARFRDGRYQAFDWTFLDFRDGRYDADLASMRRRYLAELRSRVSPATSVQLDPTS